MGLFSRHAYNQVPTTLAYGVGGTITIPRQAFNALQFSLRGLTAVTGAGANAAAGILDAITLITVRSTKYGTLWQMNGRELYWLSTIFGSLPPITNQGAGAGPIANVGFEACIPVWGEADDTIAVDVAWCPNVFPPVWHTTISAYGGVLSIVPDTIAGMPAGVVYFRTKMLAAGGILGANTPWTDTPQRIPGASLFGIYVEQHQAALSGVPLDSIATYQMEHNKAFPFGEPLNAAHLRYITAREDGVAHLAGIDILRFVPIQNDDSTVITYLNGAVGIVAGSEVGYLYVSNGLAPAIVREGQGAAPYIPPLRAGADGKLIVLGGYAGLLRPQ